MTQLYEIQFRAIQSLSTYAAACCTLASEMDTSYDSRAERRGELLESADLALKEAYRFLTEGSP